MRSTKMDRVELADGPYCDVVPLVQGRRPFSECPSERFSVGGRTRCPAGRPRSVRQSDSRSSGHGSPYSEHSRGGKPAQQAFAEGSSRAVRFSPARTCRVPAYRRLLDESSVHSTVRIQPVAGHRMAFEHIITAGCGESIRGCATASCRRMSPCAPAGKLRKVIRTLDAPLGLARA